jgi:MoxR-like ATPase
MSWDKGGQPFSYKGEAVESQQQWKDWLDGIPEEEQKVLLDILQSQHSRKVRVVKTPIEDLFIKKPPEYVDVFRLHAMYQGFNFQTNLLVKGPKGDGKSLSVTTFAHLTDTPLIVQECSEDTKKMDLMGTQNLLGDETIFTLGCIPAAIETANEYGRCILCFEEVNALTNQVQKMLNAVTDFRKQCSLPFLGKTYSLQEGAFLWVVGLMNPSAYSGTYDLNEDLKSRFEEIDLPYPGPGLEKTILLTACKNVLGQKMPTALMILDENNQKVESHYVDEAVLNALIKLAGETRQQATAYSLSTRDLVRITTNFATFGPETALQFVLCKFEGEEDKNTMKKRISSIFIGMDQKLGNYWGKK